VDFTPDHEWFSHRNPPSAKAIASLPEYMGSQENCIPRQQADDRGEPPPHDP